MLSVLLDGPRVVSVDVLRRTTVEDLEALESLLQTELEMVRAASVRSVRECAEAGQDFLDAHPEWGR